MPQSAATMCVLCQQLHSPKVSFVLHTARPSDWNTNILLVEAAPGQVREPCRRLETRSQAYSGWLEESKGIEEVETCRLGPDLPAGASYFLPAFPLPPHSPPDLLAFSPSFLLPQGETLAAATSGTPWRFEVDKSTGQVNTLAFANFSAALVLAPGRPEDGERMHTHTHTHTHIHTHMHA